jgi:hypothetical protein
VVELSTVPIRYVAIGRASIEDEACWLEDSGIGLEGALLVRPDQHVAWRAASLPADPSSALREAMTQIVEGRSS